MLGTHTASPEDWPLVPDAGMLLVESAGLNPIQVRSSQNGGILRGQWQETEPEDGQTVSPCPLPLWRASGEKESTPCERITLERVSCEDAWSSHKTDKHTRLPFYFLKECSPDIDSIERNALSCRHCYGKLTAAMKVQINSKLAYPVLLLWVLQTHLPPCLKSN